MQKRFYYELMGIAALAILGTLLLVVAVCFSYMNPEYLSGQQQEKMILVLMIGIAAIMAFLLFACGNLVSPARREASSWKRRGQ